MMIVLCLALISLKPGIAIETLDDKSGLKSTYVASGVYAGIHIPKMSPVAWIDGDHLLLKSARRIICTDLRSNKSILFAEVPTKLGRVLAEDYQPANKSAYALCTTGIWKYESRQWNCVVSRDKMKSIAGFSLLEPYFYFFRVNPTSNSYVVSAPSNSESESGSAGDPKYVVYLLSSGNRVQRLGYGKAVGWLDNWRILILNENNNSNGGQLLSIHDLAKAVRRSVGTADYASTDGNLIYLLSNSPKGVRLQTVLSNGNEVESKKLVGIKSIYGLVAQRTGR